MRLRIWMMKKRKRRKKKKKKRRRGEIHKNTNKEYIYSYYLKQDIEGKTSDQGRESKISYHQCRY
jgi:hypothetical protein